MTFTASEQNIVNSLSERWSSVDEYGNYHVNLGISETEKILRRENLSDRIPHVGYERQLSPHLVAYNIDDNVIMLTLVNVKPPAGESKAPSRRKSRTSKKQKSDRDEKEFEFAGYKFTSGPSGTKIKRKYV